MKDIGYGKDYAYDHDAQGFSGANYWPEGMAPKPSTALRTRLRARDREAAGMVGAQRRERQQGG
jgi:putative ATPase